MRKYMRCYCIKCNILGKSRIYEDKQCIICGEVMRHFALHRRNDILGDYMMVSCKEDLHNMLKLNIDIDFLIGSSIRCECGYRHGFMGDKFEFYEYVRKGCPSCYSEINKLNDDYYEI